MKIKNLLIFFLTALLAFSCSTVNKLDEYEVEGKTMKLEVTPAMPPEVDVNYHHTDSDSLIVQLAVIGTNAAKAAEAQEVEDRLIEALREEDIPEKVALIAYEESITSLNAYKAESIMSDLAMVISVESYGIRESYSNSLHFFIQVDARIYDKASEELIWRRYFDESDQISPDIFGFSGIVDNFVTIGMLQNIEDDELYAGIKSLSESVAARIAKRLHEDYLDVRYN